MNELIELIERVMKTPSFSIMVDVGGVDANIVISRFSSPVYQLMGQDVNRIAKMLLDDIKELEGL